MNCLTDSKRMLLGFHHSLTLSSGISSVAHWLTMYILSPEAGPGHGPDSGSDCGPWPGPPVDHLLHLRRGSSAQHQHCVSAGFQLLLCREFRNSVVFRQRDFKDTEYLPFWKRGKWLLWAEQRREETCLISGDWTELLSSPDENLMGADHYVTKPV